MGSSDPTLREKTYWSLSCLPDKMFWPAVAAALSLVLTARAEDSDQILQDDPCLAKTKVVGDVQYCDRYWECEFGEPELYDCPNGLVWVGKNQGIADGCDYPWRHSNICNQKDLANPPQSTEQFCIGGLLYNEETHACDWPQNVAGCQKHPLCKDDANGNVPLGKSCNRYWACQGGYPRLQRCPAMLVFDKNRKRCMTPPTEDCDVPTTNAPPPGENNSGDNSKSRKKQQSNPRRQNSGQRRNQQAQRSPQEDQGQGERQSFNPDNLPKGLELPDGAQPFNNQN